MTDARAQLVPVPASPTEGGPFGSAPTVRCSDLPGAYCHVPGGSAPLGDAAGVRTYLDNAARNWGCTWNAASQPVVAAGDGSFSKAYGNEADAASGCGTAYWNRARQAAFFVPRSDRGANVAAGSAGATASASSTYNGGTPASALIDGNRRGTVWASGGGWSSLHNPTVASPQWVQVNLNGTRRIQEIVVTTLQDNYTAPVEPTTGTAFTTYGIRDYAVQYWSGSIWVTAGAITGNTRVLRRFTFPPVQTTAVRVTITAALQGYARVVEVEAYEASTTSPRISERYASLRGPAGALGLPVANPVGYGWAGATYQQFTNGLVTHVRGHASAFAVGGTAAEDRALAEKYAEVFGVSPAAGPAIYGLAQEPGCTSLQGTGCGDATGRYVQWRDAYQNTDEMILARTGWTTAVRVPGAVLSAWTQRYGVRDPWNGELGFPLTDLLPTGSATYHQEFESGSILWEPSACTSGTYTARIVPQFRRPISDANLTMLCDANPPANPTVALPSEPVPFAADGVSGAYRFRSGSQSGWFTGVDVRLDGGRTAAVNGPFYAAWIGGASGGGNVADALSETGLASDWGPPTGDATCADNPCTTQLQRFAHGLAFTGLSGIVGWAPTGVDLPDAFGPVARGYTTPPPPADKRTPIDHRSGDYVTLVWRNQSTADGVTTTLSRTMKPLNGAWTAWVPIMTYPPPTLPKGTFTEFTDLGPVNNAQVCYRIDVTDGFNSDRTSSVCTYTLDGRLIEGVDRSRPRGVSRAQLRITVPTEPDDSATRGPVGASLRSSAGIDYNFTYLDSTAAGPQDFQLGTTRTYDLRLNGLEDVADIVGIVVTSDHLRIEGEIQFDNLKVSQIQLLLDNVLVFSKAFDPPQTVNNSGGLGGSTLEVGFEELRSNPLWRNIYAANPNAFLGFRKAEFASKLDSILATAVFQNPGAAYHGSRLRDGFPTTLSKPSGYQRDRIHVRQNVTADLPLGIFCTIDYDLRITAQDFAGNEVSPFFNGPPPGLIYTTKIKLEHPHVDCTTTFMRKILYTIFSTGQFYPTAMGQLEDDMETTLSAQAPNQVQSAPPPGVHFCFPGSQEGIGGPEFQNGGLTVCGD